MLENLTAFEIVFGLTVLAIAVHLRKSPKCGRKLAPEILDKENFRIDSTGWKLEKLSDGTRVKTNPEGDVTELLDGEFAGEQYFTLPAALRETAKAGKRLPTKEEWATIVRSVNPAIDPGGGWQDDTLVRETFGLELAGHRNYGAAAFYLQNTLGFYWGTSPAGTGCVVVRFSATQMLPAVINHPAYGFSVRCLAD